MKKLAPLFIVCAFILLSGNINAQNTTADIFKVDEITWYGFDFSNIRLIGSEGFTDPDNIQSSFFNSWNNLVKVEADKYDIGKFFNKKKVNMNLDLVKERNADVDPDQLVIDEEYSFEESKVREIIGEYGVEGDGIGLVFVMEAFNKWEQTGYMWVTFFDESTKEVLFTEYMEGKAGGFGLRNYWAKSYYNVMKEVEKKKYKEWEKEYK